MPWSPLDGRSSAAALEDWDVGSCDGCMIWLKEYSFDPCLSVEWTVDSGDGKPGDMTELLADWVSGKLDGLDGVSVAILPKGDWESPILLCDVAAASVVGPEGLLSEWCPRSVVWGPSNRCRRFRRCGAPMMFYSVYFSIVLRSGIILTNFRSRFLGRERIFALLQCFYAKRARGKRAIAGNERSGYQWTRQ